MKKSRFALLAGVALSGLVLVSGAFIAQEQAPLEPGVGPELSLPFQDFALEHNITAQTVLMTSAPLKELDSGDIVVCVAASIDYMVGASRKGGSTRLETLPFDSVDALTFTKTLRPFASEADPALSAQAIDVLLEFSPKPGLTWGTVSGMGDLSIVAEPAAK